MIYSQTFSSFQCYDSYTLLFIHVCSKWNFGLSLRETSLLTLGRQVCAVLQNTRTALSVRSYCCMLSAHRVRVLWNSSIGHCRTISRECSLYILSYRPILIFIRSLDKHRVIQACLLRKKYAFPYVNQKKLRENIYYFD